MDPLRLKILHYLASGGTRCINCGSDNLEWDSSDTDGQQVSCNECGWSWYDCFTVVSLACITDEKGNERYLDVGESPLLKSVGAVAEDALYKEIGGKENLPTVMGLSPALDEYIERKLKEMS